MSLARADPLRKALVGNVQIYSDLFSEKWALYYVTRNDTSLITLKGKSYSFSLTSSLVILSDLVGILNSSLQNTIYTEFLSRCVTRGDFKNMVSEHSCEGCSDSPDFIKDEGIYFRQYQISSEFIKQFSKDQTWGRTFYDLCAKHL